MHHCNTDINHIIVLFVAFAFRSSSGHQCTEPAGRITIWKGRDDWMQRRGITQIDKLLD